jgi:hypothetical protein
VNVIAFDEAVQSELLRLNAGDAVSIQCAGRIIIFEKNGEQRASLDVMASYVLAPRQPPKERRRVKRGGVHNRFLVAEGEGSMTIEVEGPSGAIHDPPTHVALTSHA